MTVPSSRNQSSRHCFEELEAAWKGHQKDKQKPRLAQIDRLVEILCLASVNIIDLIAMAEVAFYYKLSYDSWSSLARILVRRKAHNEDLSSLMTEFVKSWHRKEFESYFFPLAMPSESSRACLHQVNLLVHEKKSLDQF